MEQTNDLQRDNLIQAVEQNEVSDLQDQIIDIWQFNTTAKRASGAVAISQSSVKNYNDRLIRIAKKYSVTTFSFLDLFESLLKIAEDKIKLESQTPKEDNSIYKNLLNAYAKTLGINENDHASLSNEIVKQNNAIKSLAALIDDPAVNSPDEVSEAIKQMITATPKTIEVERELLENQLLIDLTPIQLQILTAIQQYRESNNLEELTKQQIIKALTFNIAMITNENGYLKTGITYNKVKNTFQITK